MNISSAALIFSGILLRLASPQEAFGWLSEKLALKGIPDPDGHAQAFTHGGRLVLDCPGCPIYIEASDRPLRIQTAAEGHYTGLSHIAFRSSDLEDSIRMLKARQASLVNGDAVSHNPGMDYINPICPFGFGLEISRLTKEPLSPMHTPTDGLDHIGIPVPDIKKSISWYEMLGFSVVSYHETHRDSDNADILCAMMSGCGTTLELYEFAHMEHEPWTDQPFASLLFETKDCEALAARLSNECIVHKQDGVLVLRGPGGETLTIWRQAENQTSYTSRS